MSRQDAQNEARDVAFDALSGLIGDRIHTDLFDRHVRPAYESARSKLVHALAEDHDWSTSDPTYRQLADARHRAAAALIVDAGAAVPEQTDWHWEEYANANKGGPDEYLVFVRFDLNEAQLDRLTATYDGRHQQASQRIPAFPLLAFAFADFRGGYLDVDKLGSSIEADGLRRALTSTGQ